MEADKFKRDEAELILWSKVRYFPLPETDWFEVNEGWLRLKEGLVEFEPQYTIGKPEGRLSSKKHLIKCQFPLYPIPVKL